MTAEDVLENLRALIGRELEFDDVICAFEDYEENGETYVYFGDSTWPGYEYVAYINTRNSTEFYISVQKIYDDETCELIKEIIFDVMAV